VRSQKLKEPRVGNGEGKGNPLQYSCLENPMDRRVGKGDFTKLVFSFGTEARFCQFWYF